MGSPPFRLLLLLPALFLILSRPPVVEGVRCAARALPLAWLLALLAVLDSILAAAVHRDLGSPLETPDMIFTEKNIEEDM